MKDERKRHAQKGKKPYLKPEVKQVQLKPEEAVLGGCKTTTSAGPAKVTCRFLGSDCSSIGTS
jgi:hypothetical protein